MASEYPKRPKYFAHKFVRKMAKVCLANEIGPEACWMLTIIAHTEDAKHYKGPVTFSNGQLMPLVGLFSVPSLARAREKAVEAGWLHYEAGMKHRAGVYWVTLPEKIQDIDDLPTDDSEDEFSYVNLNASLNASGDEAQPKAEGNHKASVQASVRQPSGKRKASVHPSSLVPNPDPNPNTEPPSPFDPKAAELPDTLNTPRFRAAWEEWCDYRAERKPKLTERSVKLQLKDMTTWGESAAIEAINLAIRNGWQGVFPPDKKKGFSNAKQSSAPSLRYDPTRDGQSNGDYLAFGEVVQDDPGAA